jgi:hypothetical protein
LKFKEENIDDKILKEQELLDQLGSLLAARSSRDVLLERCFQERSFESFGRVSCLEEVIPTKVMSAQLGKPRLFWPLINTIFDLPIYWTST